MLKDGAVRTRNTECQTGLFINIFERRCGPLSSLSSQRSHFSKLSNLYAPRVCTGFDACGHINYTSMTWHAHFAVASFNSRSIYACTPSTLHNAPTVASTRRSEVFSRVHGTNTLTYPYASAKKVKQNQLLVCLYTQGGPLIRT